MITQADRETLRDLEESLWRPETRFDMAHQQKVFGADFFEFGRSGKTYTREEVILTKSEPILTKLPLPDLKIHSLDANNALLTYRSEGEDEERKKSVRCSVWSRTADGWILRFHQATPV